MGSNMAEAHPLGFRWPMRAKEKGATLMHVDPRFTRTSALCDVFVGIRAGTDIAFLGGVINHVLTHERWFREYVLAYTNASTIIQEGFQDTEDLARLFSGYDPKTHRYNAHNGHWGYQRSSNDTSRAPAEPMVKEAHGVHGESLMAGSPAHHRRADHPHRGRPPAAPGQRRPARRRHHGDARPLQHPGFDGRADAVRPPARLPAPADRRSAARRAEFVRRARGAAHRLLGQ